MSHFTVEQWVTLISALTAAIVAILNAMKGKTLETKIDQHAATQAAQHQETLSAVASSLPTAGKSGLL